MPKTTEEIRSELIFSAGGFTMILKDGGIQMAGDTLNFGASAPGNLYEPILLGQSTLKILQDIVSEITDIWQELLTPLIGTAAYPPTLTAKVTASLSKLIIFANTDLSDTISPALSKQGNIAP